LIFFPSGDPALDYIGTGGAEYPGAEYLPEDSVIPGMYTVYKQCGYKTLAVANCILQL